MTFTAMSLVKLLNLESRRKQTPSVQLTTMTTMTTRDVTHVNCSWSLQVPMIALFWPSSGKLLLGWWAIGVVV